MNSKPILMAVLMAVSGASPGGTDQEAAQRQVIRLWQGDAPGAKGTAEKDIPTLTCFRAEKALTPSAAMVVLPGGGYQMLANYEGGHYARWFNELGIHAFVLKYRLGSAGYRHPCMLQDAARAVRTVRANAAEWGVDPARIGIIGSSAGGHLASTVLTHFDAGDAKSTDSVEQQSSRPDLGILCYPVISATAEFAHKGSIRNLLGDNPSPGLLQLLSNELQITKSTPPVFLFHTANDGTVRVENALAFSQGMAKAGVPFEIHVYPKGPHGIGLGSHDWNPAARHPWTTECVRWLKGEGFIGGSPASQVTPAGK